MVTYTWHFIMLFNHSPKKGELGCSASAHQEKPYNFWQLFWTINKILLSHSWEMDVTPTESSLWSNVTSKWDSIWITVGVNKSNLETSASYGMVCAIQGKNFQPLGKNSKERFPLDKSWRAYPMWMGSEGPSAVAGTERFAQMNLLQTSWISPALM